MSFDRLAAIIPDSSTLIPLVGLLLVVVQLHAANRQREIDSLVKILDVNRQLLGLAFSHPELRPILDDAKGVDPKLEEYYLQLWLNHFSLAHAVLKRSMLRGEFRESLKRGISDFMQMENMRRHWQQFGAVYPPSFQRYVTKTIKIAAPHDAEPIQPELSGREHLSGNFFKSGLGHAHEGLPGGSRENRVFGGGRDIPLDEKIAVVGDYGGRTLPATAQFGKLPVFPNDFLDSHFSFVLRPIRFLKQNYSFCFKLDREGAFV